MTTGKNTEDGFAWAFQRLGGLIQVQLRDGADLCRLRELDPKLWVALSCPASGLEFDSRTLSLIDKDKDDRIRIPEVTAAAEWACRRLKEPGILLQPGDTLPLTAIDDSTPAGRRLLATAKAILRGLGQKGAEALTQEDVCQAAAHASEQMFNGDGILPPLPGMEQDVRAYINDAMAVMGGVEDAGGDNGINIDISRAFIQTLRDWSDWRNSVGQASTPLGDHTAEAWQLFSELRDKIDDYFLRCELVSYAPGAEVGLNVDEKSLAAGGPGLLDAGVLTALPLARAEADKPLDLVTGINPAWRERLARFGKLVEPMLSEPGVMHREDWRKLRDGFAPYAGAISKKPDPAPVEVTLPPTAGVDKLGDERIRELLSSDLPARFEKLAHDDANVPAAASDIAEVERLVLYRRHLHRLLVNFISFEEFYSLKKNAAFQSGVLYIDGRSCRLCMPAEKAEEHAALAANSQLFLVYCECTRGRKATATGEPEKLTIVAAVTAGDSDLLLAGRNGVYVDNEGMDWDATVVKVVSNPIGLWQALWNPYKRIGNLITDYLGKYANSKQNDIMTTAGQKLEQLVTAPSPLPTARFDIGRNVGIFAAVGLALGAIGTAVGSIVNALFGMAWWQFPLLFGGLFAVISGPSLFMAWLKLRQRTLGPLLEASGWAVNGRVPVNYTLSRKLTATAVLPPNSRRTLNDPLSRMRTLRAILFLCVGAGILAGLGYLSLRHYWRERNLSPRPSSPIVSAPAPAAEKEGTTGAAASVPSLEPK